VELGRSMKIFFFIILSYFFLFSIWTAYQNLYIVEPGTSMVVESMPDPVGLKMGVIVGVIHDTQELIYQRFQCKNEAIFNISEIMGEDISFYGG
jgi:hypothetical protein